MPINISVLKSPSQTDTLHMLSHICTCIKMYKHTQINTHGQMYSGCPSWLSQSFPFSPSLPEAQASPLLLFLPLRFNPLFAFSCWKWGSVYRHLQIHKMKLFCLVLSMREQHCISGASLYFILWIYVTNEKCTSDFSKIILLLLFL